MNKSKVRNVLSGVALGAILLAGCGTTQSTSSTSTTAKSTSTASTTAQSTSSASTTAQPAHWSYEGDTGPNKWANLDPTYTKCVSGKEQSPIDIELSKVKVDKTLTDVQINYKPTSFTFVNNGHSIQANDSSNGSNSIVVDGVEYKLVQFHFHRPSENEINGQNFDMEGHLVHQSKDGKIAVLAFLIKVGKENKQLAELWSKLPKQETKEAIKLDNPVDLPNLLPKDKKVYRYDGSLTTPPCSEPVKWLVLQQPIEMSKEQVAAFGAIFPDNHRPVQQLNNRQVTTN